MGQLVGRINPVLWEGSVVLGVHVFGKRLLHHCDFLLAARGERNNGYCITTHPGICWFGFTVICLQNWVGSQMNTAGHQVFLAFG